MAPSLRQYPSPNLPHQVRPRSPRGIFGSHKFLPILPRQGNACRYLLPALVLLFFTVSALHFPTIFPYTSLTSHTSQPSNSAAPDVIIQSTSPIINGIHINDSTLASSNETLSRESLSNETSPHDTPSNGTLSSETPFNGTLFNETSSTLSVSSEVDQPLTIRPTTEITNVSLLTLPHNATTSIPPPDHCVVIGTDPTRERLWLDNSRTLCLTNSVCLRNEVEPHFYRIAPRPTICSLRRISLHSHTANLSERLADEFDNCTNFQRRKITCVYGTRYNLNRAVCPEEHIIADTSAFDAENGTVKWVQGLTVLAPEYPYQRNIFHFSNVVPYLAFVASHLQQLVDQWRQVAGGAGRDMDSGVSPAPFVNFVIRGKLNKNGWQQEYFHAVFKELVSRLGFEVRLQFLGDLKPEDVTCVQHAVQLGSFGDINVWPFGNDTEVAKDGRSVPMEAVVLKEAVYRAAGLPPLEIGGVNGEVEKRLRRPPLVVGYARRMAKEDLEGAVGDNVKELSTARVFEAEDEIWFQDMLKEEVEGQGLELRIFMTKNTETFAEQVGNMEELGLVVGIHGANLVNTMFMQPFAGLLEIFPFGAYSRCYYAGMNSGLAYWSLETTDSSGGFRCNEKVLECRLDYRNRNVYLRAGDDREKLRELVRQGVTYLKDTHKRYEDGVPVRLDRQSGVYVVVE